MQSTNRPSNAQRRPAVSWVALSSASDMGSLNAASVATAKLKDFPPRSPLHEEVPAGLHPAAAVHPVLGWKLTGDKGLPGEKSPPSTTRGTATFVLVEQGGRWLFSAVHNGLLRELPARALPWAQ